jgi:hypothetical protein
MFAGTFAYISGSSLVLQQDYGLTAQQFSLVFAVNGLGIVLLGQASGFLVGRAATERTLLRSLAAASLGGLGVLLCAALDLPLPLLLACLLFVVVSMLGVVLPSATSLAIAGGSAAGGVLAARAAAVPDRRPRRLGHGTGRAGHRRPHGRHHVRLRRRRAGHPPHPPPLNQRTLTPPSDRDGPACHAGCPANAAPS